MAPDVLSRQALNPGAAQPAAAGPHAAPARGTATLEVRPFQPMAGRDRDAITAEGERLLSFAHPDDAARDIRLARVAG
jgi:hypothetical protein